MSLDSTINNLVADTLDLDEDDIRGELSPDDTEYWDSMAHLTIVTAIEGEFGIKLTMEEVQSIGCVNDMYMIVRNHLGNK